ncbi:outer membrane beta-barrel protein [Pyxidicoccus xibeiensis]|uniref:outer membrane beta-barrel protein n=1 Tax=Pyxidicoccus xibeiensis TaxID=2906759 RepID=UPI0020A72F17|nr:outer membrane beta-barrel protein [Pyxidicoccus xibeiensis]MCP3138304.1 porin family protein [Pyxidicoccus xibeiensis]
MSTLPKLAALSLVLSAPAALADDSEKGPGFSLGLRAGYGVPFGSAVGAENEGSEAPELSDSVSGMVPVQLDVGYFINSNLYLGGSFQYGFGFLAEDEDCDGDNVSCGVSQMRFGVNLAYHFAPQAKINPWLGVGAGYETLTLSISGEENGVSAEASSTAKGFEFVNAQGGVDFNVSDTVSVGPFVTYTVAQYSSTTMRIDIEGLPGDGEEEETEDIENTAIHSWLYGGVRMQVRF